MKLTRLNAAWPMGRALRRQVAGVNRRRFARWSKAVPRGLDAKIRARRKHHCDRLGRPKGRVWSDAIAWQVAHGIGAGGNVQAVARRLGIPNQTIYRHHRADAHFQALWERELDKRHLALEEALLDRLTNGWDEDIIYQGEKTGTRRKYDNGNAVRLLEQVRREERLERVDARAERKATREEAIWQAHMREVEVVTTAAETAGGGEAGEAASTDRAVTHRERDLLLVQMMERHRNRHPDEWEGDVHVASGFDLRECAAYREG